MNPEEPTDVVIGAGSGMGHAAATLLAGSGRRLLVVDRDETAVASLAPGLPGAAVAVACDITDDAAVSELVGMTGNLGRLIVTAGLSPNMADGRRMIEVNLIATDRLVRAFEPIVSTRSVGVLFASMAAHGIPADPAVDGLLDQPESPTLLDDLDGLGLLEHAGLAYAISKRGVVRLVERRASIWGASGGRLFSVSPGIIDTPMGRLESANQPVMADMVARSALARTGRPEEVAAVAVFLASRSGSFLTGTDVLVDGGATASQRFAILD